MRLLKMKVIDVYGDRAVARALRRALRGLPRRCRDAVPRLSLDRLRQREARAAGLDRRDLRDPGMRRMPSRLSSLLVRDGLVGVKRMEKAFQRQVIYGGSLDTILLEMNLVPEERLTQYLALASGLPPAARDEGDAIDAERAAADRRARSRSSSARCRCRSRARRCASSCARRSRSASSRTSPTCSIGRCSR